MIHAGQSDPSDVRDLERLCVAVWRDEALQVKLRATTDEGAFVAAIVEAGAGMGLRIEAADIVTRMRGNFSALMLSGVLV